MGYHAHPTGDSPDWVDLARSVAAVARRIANGPDVDDVVQDTLTALLRRARQPPHSWLALAITLTQANARKYRARGRNLGPVQPLEERLATSSSSERDGPATGSGARTWFSELLDGRAIGSGADGIDFSARQRELLQSLANGQPSLKELARSVGMGPRDVRRALLRIQAKLVAARRAGFLLPPP